MISGKASEQNSKKPFNRDGLFLAIRIIVSAGLFSFLIFRNYASLKTVLPEIRGFNHYYLAISLILFFAGIYITTVRWDILLRAQRIYIFKGFLLQSYYIGFFYSNILPTNVGGDIYRAYDLHKNKGINLHKNISVIFMERFISAAVGTLYVVISFFIIHRYINLQIILGFLVLPAAMLILFLIIIRPGFFKIYGLFRKFRKLHRVEEKFNEFRCSFFEFKNKLRYIFLSILACTASQMLFIACYYYVNLYVKINLDFFSFLFLNPLIILSSNIPVSIGGIGVRENIAVLLLRQFGIAESDGVIFSLVVLSIIIINSVIGGITYLAKNIFYKSRGFL